MKIISKISFAIISAICALTFTSCEDSSEILFKIEAIYSSPIAVKGGFDTGWTQIAEGTEKHAWESVIDAGNQAYGGVGYAAYFYECGWLISPQIYLEAGKKYQVEFYGRTYDYSYSAECLYCYITESNNPEDISLLNPTKSYFHSNSYYAKQIDYIPEKSGYYYCAFKPGRASDRGYITGFKVTTKQY